MNKGEWIRVDYINYAIEVFIESRDLPEVPGASWKSKQIIAKELMDVDTYPRDYFRFVPKLDEGDIDAGRFGSPEVQPTVNLIEEADKLMAIAHKDQKYGQYDYVMHPREVKRILTEEFKHCFQKKDMIILACGGLLHDVVEDSNTTYREINRQFGGKIGKVVYGVTNENGLTPYHRIKRMRLTTAVKLGDRIHNLRSCIAKPENASRQVAKYVKADERFYYELCETSRWGSNSKLKPMWEEYRRLVDKLKELV